MKAPPEIMQYSVYATVSLPEETESKIIKSEGGGGEHWGPCFLRWYELGEVWRPWEE